MDERGIIIADRDGEYRRQMAQFFENAGYAVETTDSAVHVLCSILEKQTPVLLLGNDFDKKVSSADLIHLLKKCNRNLSVIMVSDNLPLPQARKVRHEGIFYHALKPSSPDDTEEIGLAVECAFGKGNPAAAEDDGPQLRRQDVCNCDLPIDHNEAPLKNLFWMMALIVLVLVASCLALFAAEGILVGDTRGIWLFLSFCALVVVTQVLPIFRFRLPLRRRSRPSEEDSEPFEK